jgi:hypothetical protein
MDIDDAKVYAWDKFYGWQLKGKDDVWKSFKN